jgi:hypothetical protein
MEVVDVSLVGAIIGRLAVGNEEEEEKKRKKRKNKKRKGTNHY